MTKKDDMILVEVGEMHGMSELTLPFPGVLLRCSEEDCRVSAELLGRPVALLAADDHRLLTSAASLSLLRVREVLGARDGETAEVAAGRLVAERDAPSARPLTEAEVERVLAMSRATAESEAARDAQTACEAACEAASDAWAERCAAMKAQWKDVSSFSRGDKGRVPDTFQLDGVSYFVTIYRRLGLPGWVVSCDDLGIEGRGLAVQDPEDAKTEAILFIRRRLARMTEELDMAAPATGTKEAK